jgi:Protein of unknown function (DUF2809)
MGRSRIAAAISLAIVIPIGYYGKLYRGPAHVWVNDSFASIFYEILWCALAFFVNPRWRPAPIAISVFGATCVLEFLQLWHPPFLQWARSYFLGRSLLGDFFDWSDFLYYFAGSTLGYLWLGALPVSSASSATPR